MSNKQRQVSYFLALNFICVAVILFNICQIVSIAISKNAIDTYFNLSNFFKIYQIVILGLQIANIVVIDVLKSIIFLSKTNKNVLNKIANCFVFFIIPLIILFIISLFNRVFLWICFGVTLGVFAVCICFYVIGFKKTALFVNVVIACTLFFICSVLCFK